MSHKKNCNDIWSEIGIISTILLATTIFLFSCYVCDTLYEDHVLLETIRKDVSINKSDIDYLYNSLRNINNKGK